MFRQHILYIYIQSSHTIRVQCADIAITVRASYINSKHTLPIQYAHITYPVRAHYLYSIITLPTQYAQFNYTERTVYLNSAHSLPIQNAQFTYTVRTNNLYTTPGLPIEYPYNHRRNPRLHYTPFMTGVQRIFCNLAFRRCHTVYIQYKHITTILPTV